MKKNKGLKKISVLKDDRNLLRNSQSKELNMICILTSERPYFLDNSNIRWTPMKNKHYSFKDKAENKPLYTMYKPSPGWFTYTTATFLMECYGSKNEGSLQAL